MTAYIDVYLYCDGCSRSYDKAAEKKSEIRRFSKVDGWAYLKVENGSFWDFCPKCKKDQVKP